MSDYHDFVFNLRERKLIGDFEAMYRAEHEFGFDSWHQDDVNSRFDVVQIMQILRDRQYSTIVDVGCGKGSLSQLLSRFAETTIGIDISETAVSEAARRFPNLIFRVVDVSNDLTFSSFVEERSKQQSRPILFVMSQVLSYLENWSSLISATLRSGAELMVALYLPADPIGFVKSGPQLRSVIEVCGELRVDVECTELGQHIVWAIPREKPLGN
jgi:SAM-dependent methyltransferase